MKEEKRCKHLLNPAECHLCLGRSAGRFEATEDYVILMGHYDREPSWKPIDVAYPNQFTKPLARQPRIKEGDDSEGLPSTELPLFVVSPPGSIEAKKMGYLNVGKIIKDPPKGLMGKRFPKKASAVHSFYDGAIGELPKSIRAQFQHSLEQSNAWVHRKQLDDYYRTPQKTIPPFPEFLEYAVPWILCEWGLDAYEEDRANDLKSFHRKTIINKTKWNPDLTATALAIISKAWRDIDRTPINYLRAVIKREIRKEEANQAKEPGAYWM